MRRATRQASAIATILKRRRSARWPRDHHRYRAPTGRRARRRASPTRLASRPGRAGEQQQQPGSPAASPAPAAAARRSPAAAPSVSARRARIEPPVRFRSPGPVRSAGTRRPSQPGPSARRPPSDQTPLLGARRGQSRGPQIGPPSRPQQRPAGPAGHPLHGDQELLDGRPVASRRSSAMPAAPPGGRHDQPAAASAEPRCACDERRGRAQRQLATRPSSIGGEDRVGARGSRCSAT